MTPRLAPVLVALAAACSSNQTGVDPDAINGFEKAAVQAALDKALAKDSLYPTLAQLVLPYVDRASRVLGPGDTTRVVGIQLDIDATQSGIPVVAQLSALLAWNHYRPLSRTVDSVFFIIGAGLTPQVSDSLSAQFTNATPGTGTGFAIHQAADSTTATWLARTGAFHISTNVYGGGVTQFAGGITLTSRRGSVTGDYHMTAKLVPDSSTQVSAAANFAGGIQALKIEIRGTLR